MIGTFGSTSSICSPTSSSASGARPMPSRRRKTGAGPRLGFSGSVGVRGVPRMSGQRWPAAGRDSGQKRARESCASMLQVSSSTDASAASESSRLPRRCSACGVVTTGIGSSRLASKPQEPAIAAAAIAAPRQRRWAGGSNSRDSETGSHNRCLQRGHDHGIRCVGSEFSDLRPQGRGDGVVDFDWMRRGLSSLGRNELATRSSRSSTDRRRDRGDGPPRPVLLGRPLDGVGSPPNKAMQPTSAAKPVLAAQCQRRWADRFALRDHP